LVSLGNWLIFGSLGRFISTAVRFNYSPFTMPPPEYDPYGLMIINNQWNPTLTEFVRLEKDEAIAQLRLESHLEPFYL